MYICICNAVNEHAVRDAVSRGCRTVGEVYRDCGVRPQCGKCGVDIAQFIRHHDATSADAPWPVAGE